MTKKAYQKGASIGHSRFGAKESVALCTVLPLISLLLSLFVKSCFQMLLYHILFCFAITKCINLRHNYRLFLNFQYNESQKMPIYRHFSQLNATLLLLLYIHTKFSHKNCANCQLLKNPLLTAEVRQILLQASPPRCRKSVESSVRGISPSRNSRSYTTQRACAPHVLQAPRISNLGLS